MKNLSRLVLLSLVLVPALYADSGFCIKESRQKLPILEFPTEVKSRVYKPRVSFDIEKGWAKLPTGAKSRVRKPKTSFDEIRFDIEGNWAKLPKVKKPRVEKVRKIKAEKVPKEKKVKKPKVPKVKKLKIEKPKIEKIKKIRAEKPPKAEKIKKPKAEKPLRVPKVKEPRVEKIKKPKIEKIKKLKPEKVPRVKRAKRLKAQNGNKPKAKEREWRDLKDEFLKANRSLEVCALQNSSSESLMTKSAMEGRWGRNDQIYTLHDKCYKQSCQVEYDQALELAHRFNAHPRYKDYKVTYYKAFIGLGICRWYNMKKTIGWSLKYQ